MLRDFSEFVRTAAWSVGHNDSATALDAWFTLLKENTDTYKVCTTGTSEIGCIYRVDLVTATYLESLAGQAERGELPFRNESKEALNRNSNESPQAGSDHNTPSAGDTVALSQSQKGEVSNLGKKGDFKLIEGKEVVAFETAEAYLGITDRHRQNLMNKGSLTTKGLGHNKKITTESLKKYLPPENPK